MAYSKTTWANETTPAINAANLNKIEQGIYDAIDSISNINTDIENIDNLIGLVPFPKLELGNISLSGTSLSYTDNFNRVRTPQGFTMRLSKGTTLKLTNFTSYRLRVLYAQTTSYTSIDASSAFTLPYDANVTLCFYKTDFSAMTVDDAKSLLVIDTNKTIKDYVDNKISVAEVDLTRVIFSDPNVSDNVFHGSTGITINDGVITLNVSSGNNWFYYNIDVTKLVDNFVILDFNLILQTGSTVKPYLFGKNTGGTNLYLGQSTITASGHYRVKIDLNYYVVYNNLDMSQAVSVGVANQSTPCSATIKNLKIITPMYSINTEKELYENLNDMFNDIESNKNNIIALNSDKYLTSPDGSKFMLSVSNSGVLSAIPTIPAKTLFIGNSLLTGNGNFGMCASASDKDYYYYVTQAILSQKPDATFDKLSGTAFEGCTSVQDAESWFTQTLLSHLDNSVNLVIIQLGDNVNTADKLTTFATTCSKLIEYIKEHAPASRVAWVGEWYSSNAKQTIISNACATKGAIFVDISTLVAPINQSSIGEVINYGVSATRNYNFDSYSDNIGNHKLTITFTVNNVEYTSVLPYTSYTVSNNVLAVTGNYGIVTQAGVASHPSDSGMYAISNKMIEALGL